MAQITVNIQKKYLFAFLGIILILGLTFIVIAAVPNPGHSTGEVDWSQNILADVRIEGKSLKIFPGASDEPFSIGGYSSPYNYIDIVSGRDSAGVKKDMRITTGAYPNWNENQLYLNGNGNVGIGIASPSVKFEVKGDSKLGVNRFFDNHACRLILNQPLAGTRTGIIAVPDECIENECLLVILNGGVGSGTFEKGLVFAKYKQAPYDIIGTSVSIWTSEGAGEELDSGIILETENSMGINGKAVKGTVSQDSKSSVILGFRWNNGNMHLYDDGPGEYAPDSWYYKSNDNGFELVVCK